jgi:hypothetical protein
MFTVVNNKVAHPAPDMIDPGRCLHVPTPAATRVLYDALEQPQTSDPQLVIDMRSFNKQSNIQAALDNDGEAARINAYLQRAMATS